MLKGQLTSAGFHVDPNGVMAKCPSKYEAAKKVAWGKFFNSGQICVAGSRLFAQSCENARPAACVQRPGKDGPCARSSAG